MVRPVDLAQRKIALAAMAKRMDAVVNTPIPVKASFTATALDPKRMHKKAINRPAVKEISWSDGCISVIGLRSLKPGLSGSTFRVEKTRKACIKGIVSSSGYKSELVTTPLKEVWQGVTIHQPFYFDKKI
jgi:hypothetical protein